MGRTSKVGIAGIFGARYGTVVRKRYAEIISEMRRPHECPKCHLKTVRRLSVGVWLCRKCNYKFAGGAYTPFTKLGEISRRASRAAVTPKAVTEELGVEKAEEQVAKPVKEPRPKEEKPRRKVVRKRRKESK